MVTMLTAMIIQTRGDDVRVQTAKDPRTGKWAGFISLFNDGNFDHYLISTEAVFETEESAHADMSGLVEKIRGLDLAAPRG